MKNIRVFLSENFQFLEVKFSIYLNRHVFVMPNTTNTIAQTHKTSTTQITTDERTTRVPIDERRTRDRHQVVRQAKVILHSSKYM